MADRFKLIPAVYLMLRRGDEVLLSRRANTGYQDGCYGLVAGHMDGDELATAAIVREAMEEVGIQIEPTDLRFVHVIHRLGRSDSQERVDFFFAATDYIGTIKNMEPAKCDDLAWFPIDDLPANTIPLVRRTLAAIEAGSTYSEYITEPL